MQPGQVARLEFEYIRHGTMCLMANFSVASGEIIAPTLSPTRKEEDFARHIQQTIETHQDAGWIFVVDQLNTHKSQSLVRLVAQQCQITEDLGVKGKYGILKSISSRAAFLSDKSHRIRFVYTPVHCSWLNQVEIWFSILVRRLLKRGSFLSTADLKQKVLDFIDSFNVTLAKPYRWSYKGRPLQG